ncbi:MAG: TetR/AcrR family transcriptional regulator [Polyangiaceae bacterium]|jgi:AcrR family transcriptional regulator
MVETILEAAARVFVRSGYPRATTNRIAEAAGISVGSLYQYFPSKDAIAVELLRRYRETLLGLVHRHLQGVEETTLESVVRALIGAVLRAEGIDPALHRVLIEQVLRTSARAEIVGFEEKAERLLAEAIRASGGRLFERDPDTTAFVIVRAVLGIVHSAVVDRPALNGPPLVDELTRLVVRLLEP